MKKDNLINQVLKSSFNPNKEDPSQYWASTLIEDIRRIGDEYVFMLRFIPIVEEKLFQPFTNHHITKYIPARGAFINTRVWNLLHGGIIHQTGHLTNNFAQKVFTRINIQINVPTQQVVSKLLDLPWAKYLKSQLRLESTSDNVNFNVFDNLVINSVYYNHIMIPCSEIARFYLFNSTILIDSLLKPGSLHSIKNELYNPLESKKNYDVNEKEFHLLYLRKEMSKTDAAIVARIAFSNEARLATLTLQKSLLNVSNNSTYVVCPSPFSGETSLKVGSLVFEYEGKKILLITEILTCSANFPFNNLVVLLDDELKNNKDKSENIQLINKKKRKKSQIPKEPELDINGLGDYDKEDIEVFSITHRFQNLNLKNIKSPSHNFKSSKEKGGEKISIIKGVSVNFHKGGRTGIVRTNTSFVESEEIVINLYNEEELNKLVQDLKEKRFDLLYKIKNEFDSREFITNFFKWIPVTEKSDFTYFINDAESVYSEWPFINYKEGRLRIGLCLHVSNEFFEFYLIEVELKGKEKASLKLFALNNFGVMAELDLEKVLHSIQKNNGKIGMEKNRKFTSILPDQFKVYRYNHYTKWNANDYVDRIPDDLKKYQ